MCPERKIEEVGNGLQLGVYASIFPELADLGEVASLIWDEGFLTEGIEGTGLAYEDVNLVDPSECGGFLAEGGGYCGNGLQAL